MGSRSCAYKQCHELRVNDEDRTWRIFYRTDADAIMIAGVEEKKTQKTPRQVIENCQRRLQRYDDTTTQ